MVQLVGILNITPDSFSDGGKFFTPADAISHAQQLLADGAAFIDVGAESTRPGATPITHEEEWARLEPVLSALLPRLNDMLSLDSYHPETVKKALAMGDIIVNDVSGLSDPRMKQLVLTKRPTIIINHITGGDIHTVHAQTLLSDIAVVRRELLALAQELEAAGLSRDSIILDPGIGFGKTPELNWQLLRFATEVPGYKVMIGYSRKRFLGEDRLELAPNLKAGQVATTHGAAYLRVHDVAGHRSLID